MAYERSVGRRRAWRPGVVPPEVILEAMAAAEAARLRTKDTRDIPSAPGLVARYPENLLPIAGEPVDFADRLSRSDVDPDRDWEADLIAAVRERYERFCDVREDLVADYTYNTARAYWGDLDDLWWWATERDKDVFMLTETDLTQYIALHRRRKYSENTIRRRMNTVRRFRAAVEPNAPRK